MDKAICVYCSSANNVAPEFFDFARQLGAEMAHQGYALVYGGTDVGLMGAVARSVHEHGGKVIGIIPETLYNGGIAYNQADELVITKDMRERKAAMEARATAFAALPGGFGTLEELFEILTLKQLKYHDKPVIVLNAHNFYNPLLGLFEHIYEQNFARPDYRELYHVTAALPDLFTYLSQYQPPQLKNKWA